MSRESVYHSPTGHGGMSERSSSARSTRGGRQALSTVRDAVAADRDPASPYAPGMMHEMGDLRKLNAMQKAVEEAREQQAVAARYRRVAESLRHGMVGFKFCWLRARLISIVSALLNHRQRQALNTWYDWQADREMQAQKLVRAAASMRATAFRKAFNSWTSRAERARAARELAGTALSRWRLQGPVRAINSLACCSHERAALRPR